MAKTYEVIFIDEWNNMYNLGFFRKLEDSFADLHTFLDKYEELYDEDEENVIDAWESLITEYPSTFSTCFDKILCTPEGCVSVRGFVWDCEISVIERK